MKDLYQLGEMPPVGQVPKRMLAQVIRQERFGEPTKAFQVEPIDVPGIAPDEVLVYVMAAGINYNNVWAALGIPVDVIKARARKDRRADEALPHRRQRRLRRSCGRSAATSRNVKVGDEVVIHCGMWERRRSRASRPGTDPMFGPTLPDLGLRDRTGAASRSSRACRRTSACPSRSI